MASYILVGQGQVKYESMLLKTGNSTYKSMFNMFQYDLNLPKSGILIFPFQFISRVALRICTKEKKITRENAA